MGAVMGMSKVLFESCFSVPQVELGKDYYGIVKKDLVIRVSGIEVLSLPVKVIYGLQGEGIFGIRGAGDRKDYPVGQRLFSDRVEGKYLTFKGGFGGSVEKVPNEIVESNGSPWETFFGFRLEIIGAGFTQDSVSSDIQGNVAEEVLEEVADAIGISLLDSEESQRELFLTGYVVSRMGDILGVGDSIESSSGQDNLALQVFGLTGSPLGDDVAHLSEGYLRRVLKDFEERFETLLSRIGYSKETVKKGKSVSLNSGGRVSSESYNKFDESKTITAELKQCSDYGIWKRS